MHYVTYEELFQYSIVLMTLIGLIVQIVKKK